MSEAKPEISNLTPAERRELIEHVKTFYNYEKEKNIVIEALDLLDKLIKDIESSKNINISEVKKLFGFRSEQLKKLLQIR